MFAENLFLLIDLGFCRLDIFLPKTASFWVLQTTALVVLKYRPNSALIKQKNWPHSTQKQGYLNK